MSAAATRRLFFALWPDSAQRAALLHATAEVVRDCGGRPVAAENLHVTLAFLGAVTETRLGDLSSVARRAAAGFAGLPLALTLAGIEHWARPQVLVVPEQQGAVGSAAAALAGILTRETAAAGFSPDLKPFRAHVTVARKVTRAPRASSAHEVVWGFGEFALIESRTLASGPVYSVLESHVLGSVEKVRT